MLDDGKSELSITKSFSLTEEDVSRGVYSIGEGIVGTVALTGKPISIPNIGRIKGFLVKRRQSDQKQREYISSQTL